MAIITSVNTLKKTVELTTFRSLRQPTGVEWTAVMFDARNGQGVYHIPKPGMCGLYFEIDGKGFFTVMFGAIDIGGVNGYTNNREEAPPGSFVIRTSRETKFVATPNLLWIQAANFCKLLMRRIDKLFDFLFYSLKMTSLGAKLMWLTDLKERTTRFVFTLKDRLAPKKDARGKTPKEDPATKLNLEFGAIKDSPDFFRFKITQGLTNDEQVSTETDAVRAMRFLTTKLLKEREIERREQFFEKGNEDLEDAFADFTVVPDLSRELLVESIVDAASYVSRAQDDTKNGLKDLSPPEDSVEALEDGALTPLGDREPEDLNPNLEWLVPANTVENKKDRDGNEALGAALVREARGAKSPADVEKLSEKLSAVISKNGDLAVSQPDGKTEWDLKELFRLGSENGPFDFNTGSGIRVQAQDGMVFLGNGAAGLALGADGSVEVTCTAYLVRVFQPKTPEEGAPADEDPGIETAAEFGLAPEGVVLLSQGEIKVQAKGSIDLIPDSAPEKESTTVDDLRAELQEVSGIIGLPDEESTETDEDKVQGLPDQGAV